MSRTIFFSISLAFMAQTCSSCASLAQGLGTLAYIVKLWWRCIGRICDHLIRGVAVHWGGLLQRQIGHLSLERRVGLLAGLRRNSRHGRMSRVRLRRRGLRHVALTCHCWAIPNVGYTPDGPKSSNHDGEEKDGESANMYEQSAGCDKHFVAEKERKGEGRVRWQ